MQHLISITLILLSALATTAVNADPAEEVKATDQRRVTALLTADSETLDQLLAPELRYTHANGMVDSKASYMASFIGRKVIHKQVTTDDVEVIAYGPVAVATGSSHVVVEYKGRDLDLNIRFTSVYRKQGNRWQLVAWQSTPVKEL
ncbi:MAG: nuclear transport factor 2 family protein [Gammaproteobacteria bacterium]|nr:nuclear transport factor 2 family protein [Gammaproteobacteria bacterium]